MTCHDLADRVAALEEHLTPEHRPDTSRDDELRAGVADYTNRLAVTIATIDARLRDLEVAVATIERYLGLPSPDFGVLAVTPGSTTGHQGSR